MSLLATLVFAALLPVLLPVREAHGQASPLRRDVGDGTHRNNYALPPWAEAPAGHPDQYKTILNGDVNGDGIWELVGRNSDHLEIWTWAGNYASVGAPPGTKAYDPPPGQWAPLAPAPDATLQTFHIEDGWWDPSLYSTFRLADLDVNRSDERPRRPRWMPERP